MDDNSDVSWTSEVVCELIDSFKEHPALWHFAHPHYNDQQKRKELLRGISRRLHRVTGGFIINEDVLYEKWRALKGQFDDEMTKARQGEVSGWEFYQRMLFLSPEVLSACRFDDLNGGIVPPVLTTSVAKAVDANIRKILGYVPKSLQQEVETVPIKRPKVAPKNCTPKPSTHWDTPSYVQQAKSEIGHILKSDIDLLCQSSPRPSMNGSKYGDFVADQSFRVCEDKWTFMGRMIEEAARELESKNPELAFRLQKEINDLIFKYQIESLKYRK
ncbi:hypothetical protein COOONC_02996 [Cooperia oncophora]